MLSLLKKILVVVLVAGSLYLLFQVFIAISRVGKTDVTFEVAPTEASITVNNRSLKPGSNYMKPGKYKVFISSPNYKKTEKDIVISKEPQYVGVILEPANDEISEKINNDPKIYLLREAIGGQLAAISSTKIRSTTPLINQLPYIDVNGPFAIDYGKSYLQKNGSTIIVSDSSPEGRINAVKWIRSQGYDPTNLDIQFDDFVNPLVSYQGESESRPRN